MNANRVAGSRYKEMSFFSLSGAFCMLAIGHGLALLAFLVELIYKRIKQHIYFDVIDDDDGRNQQVTNKEEIHPIAPPIISAIAVAATVVLFSPHQQPKPGDNQLEADSKEEIVNTVADLEDWRPIVVHADNQTIEIK